MLVGIAMVVAPTRLRMGVLGPSLAAVAVLGLASVAVVSPDAATHGHADGAAGHDHAGGSTDLASGDHAAEMAALDSKRCDLGFNPRSYWEEAPLMGVDTYTGGAMAPHASGSLADLAAAPDAFEGRGSLGLDQLISATSQANTGGEGAAAALIGELSDASEDDYDAWVAWMKSTAVSSSGSGSGSSGGHAHGSSGTTAAAPDDDGGHGGHTGPQPWKAMVDQEQCVQLSKELVLARETALKYPTAADAMAAGWVRVTRYVPGIAAHYMNFGLVDGEFRSTSPRCSSTTATSPTPASSGSATTCS